MCSRRRFTGVLIFVLALNGCHTVDRAPVVQPNGDVASSSEERAFRKGIGAGLQDNFKEQSLRIQAYATGTDDRTLVFNADSPRLLSIAKETQSDDELKTKLKSAGFDEAWVTDGEGQVVMKTNFRP